MEAKRIIRPYLDHFGSPDSTLDIASTTGDYNYVLALHDRVPLHIPAGATPMNPNGVYGCDSSGFLAKGTYYNYWGDPVFNTDIGSLAGPRSQAFILPALTLLCLIGGLTWRVVKKL